VSFYGRKVCHCCKTFSMADATKEIAPPELQPKSILAPPRPVEVWICNKCGGISHVVQEVHTVVRGPRNVAALLHSNGLANGQEILTWQEPGGKKVDTVEFHSYPRRFVVQPEPLIFQTWRLMMSKVEVILAEPEGAGDNEIQAAARVQAQHEARGIAEVLAILMKPFMDPPVGSTKSAADQVVRHAVSQFRDPFHMVPGLGEHLWDPTKNPDGTLRVPVSDTYAKTHSAKKATSAVKHKPDTKSTRKLNPADVKGIKDAIDSKMFSKEDIAVMFKVSMETLEEAIRG
jgi:hypothetical protein